MARDTDDHNECEPHKPKKTLRGAEKARRGLRKLQREFPDGNFAAIDPDPEPTLPYPLDPQIKKYVVAHVRRSLRDGKRIYGKNLVEAVGKIFQSLSRARSDIESAKYDAALTDLINWLLRNPAGLKKFSEKTLASPVSSTVTKPHVASPQPAPPEAAEPANNPSVEVRLPLAAHLRQEGRSPQLNDQAAQSSLEPVNDYGDTDVETLFAGANQLFAAPRMDSLPKLPFQYKRQGADKANDFLGAIYHNRIADIVPKGRLFAADKAAVQEVMNRGTAEAEYIRLIFATLRLTLP